MSEINLLQNRIKDKTDTWQIQSKWIQVLLVLILFAFAFTLLSGCTFEKPMKLGCCVVDASGKCVSLNGADSSINTASLTTQSCSPENGTCNVTVTGPQGEINEIFFIGSRSFGGFHIWFCDGKCGFGKIEKLYGLSCCRQ